MLKELPPDIRKQIEKAMKSKHKTHTENSSHKLSNITSSRRTTRKTSVKEEKHVEKSSSSDALSRQLMEIENSDNEQERTENVRNSVDISRYESKSQKKQIGKVVQDEEKPGCSHWKSQSLQEEAMDILQELDDESNEKWENVEPIEEEAVMEVEAIEGGNMKTSNGVNAIDKTDDPIVALPHFSQVSL